MKKSYSILFILLVIIIPLVVLTGCGDSDKASTIGSVTKTALDSMENTIKEFPEDAAKATADTKADLEQEGTDLKNSIDDLRNTIDEYADDFKKDDIDTFKAKLDEYEADVDKGLETLKTK